MYNIFVIGNANSIWTREYIRNIHVNGENNIYISAYESLSPQAEDELKEMGVKAVRLYSSNKLVDKIKKTIKLCWFCMFKYKKLNIDFIDIQSPPHTVQAKLLFLFLKKTIANVEISFWGSDILRINKEDAERIRPLLSIAQYINVCTDEMLQKFHYFYGNMFDNKLKSAKYGSPAFSEIKKLAENGSVDRCKKQFGLDEKKLVVAVGHNGNEEQQHIAVLEQLKSLDETIKDKIQLIIHLGYGTLGNYMNEVENAAIDSGISFVILDKLLDLKKIAALRVATDIIIHAQTTDALSGSIRECLYAGAILMNPSWITYKEFDENGVQYIRYDDINDISSHLVKIVKGDINIDVKKNTEIMENCFSWDSVRKEWLRIFHE